MVVWCCHAVKPDESDMVELFLREAVIMKGFEHVNVLRIIGVSFEADGSPMVVLPYMANADLRQYIMNPNLVSEARITVLVAFTSHIHTLWACTPSVNALNTVTSEK